MLHLGDTEYLVYLGLLLFLSLQRLGTQPMAKHIQTDKTTDIAIVKISNTIDICTFDRLVFITPYH